MNIKYNEYEIYIINNNEYKNDFRLKINYQMDRFFI